jgi:site-specific recombinase XerD
MEMRYYLKDGKGAAQTSIFALITLSNATAFKYSIKEKILPKDWDFDNQMPISKRKYPDLVNLLNTRKSQVDKIYRTFVLDYRKEPTREQLKQLLDEQIRDKSTYEDEQTNLFAVFFDKFIKQSEGGIRLNNSGRPLSKGTFQIYHVTLDVVKEFEKTKRKKPLTWLDMDFDFYTDFTEYLTTEKKLATNTIGKYIKTIKTVLNDATDKEINTNLKFRTKKFKTVSEETESIYLSEKELKEMELLDLSHTPYLDRVKDLFLIGSYTGARFSDWDKIRPEKVKENMITITTEKTGKKVTIPIHPTVQKIFKKYENELPRRPSNQKTNEYLKEIGKKMNSMQGKESKTLTKGGMRVTQNLEKWQRLTTHTARRSFATNEYWAGTDMEIIKAITGHTTEKSFMKYIKVTPQQQAKRLDALWAERNKRQTKLIAL